MLRNRFILGGLAILALLILTVIVLFLLGGGNESPSAVSAVGTSTPEGTPEGTPTIVASSGLVGRVITTATVYDGPGPPNDILGTVPSGASVSVSGRDDDASWLQIVYPPGSSLRGWVEADLLEVTGDIAQLAIAEPNAGPSIIVPTSPPSTATAIPTVTPTAATATPTPTALTPTPPTSLTPPSPSGTPPPPTLTPQLSPTVPPVPTETPEDPSG